MDKTEENVKLSKFYWEWVDIMVGNGFTEIIAKNVVIRFIHDFEPLTRKEIE